MVERKKKPRKKREPESESDKKQLLLSVAERVGAETEASMIDGSTCPKERRKRTKKSEERFLEERFLECLDILRRRGRICKKIVNKFILEGGKREGT